MIADHLPFEAELRKDLDRYALRGIVYDLAVKWSGIWPQPEQYSVKGRFVDLGLNAVGRVPGFTGLERGASGERGIRL